jgi:glycosyltransferase involved in cell wall biosynthesis
MEYKNVLYFNNLNVIGGVESFFYYLSKKYCNRDITILYMYGDVDQLKRLRQYVRVRRFHTGEIIKCEKAFFNYNLDIIDNIEAEEYIQIIHADYKAQGIIPNLNPKITRYIGVSKRACESFKELTGKEIELAWNPVVIDEPKKTLLLASFTRLTSEKGKEYMQAFGEKLNQAGASYLWLIFTDDRNAIKNPNIAYMSPRLDVMGYMKKADFVVQLSKSEGYGITVDEALQNGTPVIVSPCPAFKEVGITKDNSLTLEYDMSNADEVIKAMYEKEFKFKHEPKKDNWDKILAPGKSTYQEEMKKLVTVECIERYYDIELETYIEVNPEDKNYRRKIKFDRAQYLQDVGVVRIIPAEKTKK